MKGEWFFRKIGLGKLVDKLYELERDIKGSQAQMTIYQQNLEVTSKKMKDGTLLDDQKSDHGE